MLDSTILQAKRSWNSFLLHLKYFLLSFAYVTISGKSGVVLVKVLVISFTWAIFHIIVWVFLLHLPHSRYPLQAFNRWPYLWYLKYLNGAVMHFSTYLRQFPIFTCLCILGWLKVTMYVFVCISSPSFLVVFILWSVSSCFPKAVVISSAVAKDSSLLEIISYEMFKPSCGYTVLFVVLKVFMLKIFSACLQLSTFASKLPFLVFLTVCWKLPSLLRMGIICLGRLLIKIQVRWIFGILLLQSPNKTQKDFIF